MTVTYMLQKDMPSGEFYVVRRVDQIPTGLRGPLYWSAETNPADIDLTAGEFETDERSMTWAFAFAFWSLPVLAEVRVES